MAAVKGSKPPRLMVAPYRPYFRLVLGLGTAFFVVLVAFGSYFLGTYHGTALDSRAAAERDQLQRELAAKTEEATALSQQVANLTLASEVDRASSEDVRSQVIGLRGKIAALEEDIAFYRGLMAPTESRSGLTIGSVDIISTGVPRRYDFKVVVQQLATNHQVLNGSLTVKVVGYDGQTVRSISLRDLSPQVDEDSVKLRFKYFQNIEGQIELPEGFEPERIELQAKSTGSNGTSVEEKFGWLVHES